MGAAKHEAPRAIPHFLYTHSHKHTRNIASGADRFIRTKTDTMPEECRNVMFAVSARAKCLYFELILQPKVKVFFIH